MKTRRRDYSGRLTVTGRNKRLKASEIWENNSGLIPTDLLYDILSRLPVKSLARLRCVSKFWSSITRHPDFTGIFLTRSMNHPRILFSYERDDNLFLFSSNQPENPDENTNPVTVTPYPHMCPSSDYRLSPKCYRKHTPIHGLICSKQTRILNGRKETSVVICNLSTGQSLLLPRVKTKRICVRCYLAYDPIGKQYKVLAMTYLKHESYVFEEIQVLTLGTDQRWRMIECDTLHFSRDSGVCIDGALYYTAVMGHALYTKVHVMVCFDVRTEKFRFAELGNSLMHIKLVEYKGKVASIMTRNPIAGISTSIKLWVLEDFEKQEWSKHVFLLPALWNEVVGNKIACLHFVGITRSNEIVLSKGITVPFYLYYYNIEKNTFTRVRILGMEAFARERIKVRISLHHIENLKPMKFF